MIQPKIHLLKNKTKIILDYLPHIETVSLGLFAPVGSRAERKEISGISHFVEHMVFKGTKRRSLYEITGALEAKGGLLNAWTSKESTCWHSKVLKDDTDLAIDLIGDIVYNSIFPEDELEKEKKVVIEEIKQSFDDPDDLIYEYFNYLCYPSLALGRPILGSKSNVESFTQETLHNHVHTWYLPEDMTFVVSGNFEEAKLIDAVQAALPQEPFNSSLPIVEPANFTSGVRGMYIKKGLQQAQVIIGYPAISYNGDEYITYMVLSTILGCGMSSRLFKKIREEAGLAYSVYSYLGSYSDNGYLAVQLSCSPANVKKSLELTKQVIEELAIEITNIPEEIQKAKNQLIASLFMSLESSSARMNRWFTQMHRFKKLVTPQETESKLQAVNAQQLKTLLDRLLEEAPSMAVLVPEALPQLTEFKVECPELY